MASNDIFTQPNQGYFGVSPDLVGQTEAQSPNNPLLLGMMMQGNAAQKGYLQALNATQQLELANAERDRQKDMATTYLNTANNNSKMLPYLGVNAGSYLSTDPNGLERTAALAQDDQSAQTFEHRMNGYKIAASDLGYLPKPSQISDVIRGAGYMGPSAPIPMTAQPTANSIDQQRADASMAAAKASMVAANNAGKSGNKTVTTMLPDGHGGFIPMSVVATDAGSSPINVIAPSAGGPAPVTPGNNHKPIIPRITVDAHGNRKVSVQ